jgi:hypothetical protein
MTQGFPYGKSRCEHCLAQANFKDALDSFENKCFAVWTNKEEKKDPTSPMFDDLLLI